MVLSFEQIIPELLTCIVQLSLCTMIKLIINLQIGFYPQTILYQRESYLVNKVDDYYQTVALCVSMVFVCDCLC